MVDMRSRRDSIFALICALLVLFSAYFGEAFLPRTSLVTRHQSMKIQGFYKPSVHFVITTDQDDNGDDFLSLSDDANSTPNSEHRANLTVTSPTSATQKMVVGSMEEERPRSRPLLRFIDNIWYIMCIPFPDLRRLSRKRDTMDSSPVVISIRLRDGMAAVVAYLALGVLSYRFVFEKMSFVDSLYFTTVVFSTVGYGDICAKTVAGKFFTCLFGISGIALLGAAVATIGSRLIQAEIDAVKITRQQSQKRLLQVYDKMPNAVMKLRQSTNKNQRKLTREARKLLASIPHHPPFPPFLTTFWKVARYVTQSLVVVALGGLFIGKLEGWVWHDSLYYGLITASTIGLGDVAPQTQSGRLAAVVYIPISVAAAGEILASVGLAILERRQKRLFNTQLIKGLTMDTLKGMDADKDGKVTREEYVTYMLMEMGLVSKDELKELSDQFERLDATKSGYLDHDDLILMAKLRCAGLIES